MSGTSRNPAGNSRGMGTLVVVLGLLVFSVFLGLASKQILEKRSLTQSDLRKKFDEKSARLRILQNFIKDPGQCLSLLEVFHEGKMDPAAILRLRSSPEGPPARIKTQHYLKYAELKIPKMETLSSRDYGPDYKIAVIKLTCESQGRSSSVRIAATLNARNQISDCTSETQGYFPPAWLFSAAE